MIVDPFAAFLMTAAFIIMAVHVIVLIHRLKVMTLRAVNAEVDLKHYREEVALEKARNIN